MRMLSVGWVLFGLVAAMLLGYILTRGVLLRADIELQMSGGPPWPKSCEYLHWGGVSQEVAKPANYRGNAEATSCPFLKPSS